jgi:hypothetical protein
MAVDDPGENIREIAERIDVVEFTGLDQRCDGGPMVGAAVRAGEQMRPDRPLDDIEIDLDTAVGEEAFENIAPRRGIADGLGFFAANSAGSGPFSVYVCYGDESYPTKAARATFQPSRNQLNGT